MSANSILSSLRALKVMVLNPPGEVSDALVLQLIRIGCSVQQYWPPPKQFDLALDVLFVGVVQNRHHQEISKLIADGGFGVTVIALVTYESPAELSKIIELECHGVIIQPFEANRVLPTLVAARRVSEELSKLKLKNNNIQERLDKQADINRAKVLLMKEYDWGEKDAHAYLSHKAMELRTPILKIAQDIVKKHQ